MKDKERQLKILNVYARLAEEGLLGKYFEFVEGNEQKVREASDKSLKRKIENIELVEDIIKKLKEKYGDNWQDYLSRLEKEKTE